MFECRISIALEYVQIAGGLVVDRRQIDFAAFVRSLIIAQTLASQIVYVELSIRLAISRATKYEHTSATHIESYGIVDRFLKLQLDQSPFIELNSIPFDAIQWPYALVIAPEYKQHSVEGYDTSTVLSHIEGGTLSPNVFSNGVTFADGKVGDAVMAAHGVETGIG